AFRRRSARPGAAGAARAGPSLGGCHRRAALVAVTEVRADMLSGRGDCVFYQGEAAGDAARARAGAGACVRSPADLAMRVRQLQSVDRRALRVLLLLRSGVLTWGS